MIHIIRYLLLIWVCRSIPWAQLIARAPRGTNSGCRLTMILNLLFRTVLDILARLFVLINPTRLSEVPGMHLECPRTAMIVALFSLLTLHPTTAIPPLLL